MQMSTARQLVKYPIHLTFGSENIKSFITQFTVVFSNNTNYFDINDQG